MFGGCDDDEAQRGVRVHLLAADVFAGPCRRVGDVVHEEAVMGEGELLAFVVGDLGEDDGGE